MHQASLLVEVSAFELEDAVNRLAARLGEIELALPGRDLRVQLATLVPPAVASCA